MTKQQVLHVIENYNKTLIDIIVKILNKYEIDYNGKEDKLTFLEKFWKLYIEKKIAKKDTLFLDEGTIEYNFHGSGCYFRFGDIEMDSNFYNEVVWDFRCCLKIEVF